MSNKTTYPRTYWKKVSPVKYVKTTQLVIRKAKNRKKHEKTTSYTGLHIGVISWSSTFTISLLIGAGLINPFGLHIPSLLTPAQAHEEVVSLPVSTPSEQTEGVVITPEAIPLVGQATPSATPKTEKEQIIEYIREVFGKDAEDALKIAKCESNYNPNAHGDLNIMTYNQGELVGDSLGIFQIRTGGHDFNRAKANGMTADEFRTKLKDYKYNIEYAKTIFDASKSWRPWFNCMKKVL